MRKQGILDEFAKHVPGQDVDFLNARRVITRHANAVIDGAGQLATGSAGETDGDETALASDLDRPEDIWRIATGGNSESKVIGSTDSLDLPGKYFFEGIIIPDGRQNGRIRCQGESRQAVAFLQETPAELSGQVLRVRGAAAIAKEQNFISRGKTLAHGAGDGDYRL
jgi:hypothetical protein